MNITWSGKRVRHRILLVESAVATRSEAALLGTQITYLM
ncbi:hypothetical protein J2S35_000632 [Falsarthrobacter nasiphocae]|uniref:Uncharacterized protein n=1 Tax=Falsarthrobacter nasiphocae TaxID=189863 RepID=A0AAE3YFE3_9MICC|nr:hypothetical protein [Falsarthrobacter nasiphocae]